MTDGQNLEAQKEDVQDKDPSPRIGSDGTMSNPGPGRSCLVNRNTVKYSAKHPAGTTPDARIAAAVQEVADDGRVPCVLAHDLASELQVTPAEVGKTIDLLELRIIKCQLGLFGYLPGKKMLKPTEVVSNELRDRLTRATVNGAIPCATCWEIAEELDMQRIAVAAACERLDLRVRPCQLGAF